MKALGVVLLFLFVSNAGAETFAITKCSNSDGSVKWQSGVDQDFIDLKYSNFVEGTLTLEVEQVNIQMMKDVTLKEKTFRSCQYAGSTRVYAGKVKITGSDKHPDVLRSQFPENKILTEVICTTTLGMSTPCAEK